MPTPTGLPKKGDRVVWNPLNKSEKVAGIVIARGPGAYWSLTVKYDNGKTVCNVDAAYFWRYKVLRLEG